MQKYRKDKRNAIEKEVDKVLELMNVADRNSKEYEQLLDNLDKLMEMNSNLKKKNMKVDWNTLAIIAGNIIGIALILWWEEGHIVTSKALGFVLKGRV